MIGALIAALMAASFFMPWVEFFGESIGPMMLFDDAAPPLADFPWRAWVALASFPIAALAVLFTAVRARAGGLMFIAGAIPFALIGEQVWAASSQLSGAGSPFEQLGLPLPQSDSSPQEMYDILSQFVSIGAPIYFVSAALLVLFGLGRMVRGT